eukprot:CAMPEP_0119005968 /NCGR_PEP_ID=MMETSP1176-20130426/2031_1 /TAXON_ID=265551 /ORGANISM="Synedropsis recta cf, Strain CCMP1620" /LENGTH=956 /DNA_ID=CAMNT_0006957835 /DNA_START=69 /DNA_END=2939 /DNA_ORIENTATION=-
MKSWAFTVSLWGLVVGLAASQSAEYLYKDDKDAGAVIEHTTTNDFEASKKPRLVEFYSPYCGGCRNFKPKYITMAEQITAKYNDVEVYAVSCAPFKDICNKHKIKGYPALYAFPAGATEGTYLQKSSMGGSYEITAIADTLKLTEGSSSSTKSSTTKAKTSSSKTSSTKSIVDASKDAKVVSRKTEKSVASKQDDSEETVTSKKTSTKKTLKKTLKKTDASKKDKDESSDKEYSKEEEDASSDKKISAKNKRQLADEKEDEKADEDEKKEVDEEDKESDEEKPMASAKKTVGKTLTKKASIVEKEEEEEEEEKEDDKDEEKSADTDEEKSDDKDDVKEDEDDKDEDEKSADKDDEDDKSDDKDKSADQDDEDDKDDEDEKSDEKDDEDEKSDDKDDEDEKSDDKDDEDEKSDDKDDEDDDKAILQTNPLSASSAAGGVAPSRIFTGNNKIKPGRIPGAGATYAGIKQRDMDRWKTIMEQRKKTMQAKSSKMGFLRPIASTKNSASAGPGGKVNLSAPGKTGNTKLMRANTPGTPEFEERKKQILARIEKAKKKHGFPLLGSRTKASTTLVKKEMLPFKKEPKRPGLMRRGMEKVPMVKRIFKMSPEEELILDASLSFITGLKHGLFMSSDSLTDKKKDALKSWLELLSVTLPPEWGLHALIDDLSKNLNFIAKSNENLQNILAKHPSPRKLWSRSCDKKGMGGFSCGMWKLFHIVSLGVAEHHGGSNLIESGLAHAGTRTFSPADAADVIREYMAHFFGCDDCRVHFLAQYDSCAFRRCDRLADDASSATADDWKQLALWMWEVHNDVNIRVGNKKVDRIQKKLNSKHLQGAQTLKVSQKQEDEIKMLFPALDDCVVCFDESGKWNEDSVFEYLERTYWDAPDAKFDRLLTSRNVEGEDVSGGGFIWIMMIIALCIVVSLRRHVNNLSFKNNFQVASVMSVGNKIGDVVAGKQRTA